MEESPHQTGFFYFPARLESRKFCHDPRLPSRKRNPSTALLVTHRAVA